MLAVVLALSAAAGWGTAAIFARLGSQGLNPRAGAALSMFPSVLIAMIPALVLDLPAFVEIPVAGFLWLALVAVINFPMGRLFNFVSISRIGAARAAPLFASAPLWAAIMAVIFLGERPNVFIVLGTLIAVMGIVLIVSEGRRNESRSRS